MGWSCGMDGLMVDQSTPHHFKYNCAMCHGRHWYDLNDNDLGLPFKNSRTRQLSLSLSLPSLYHSLSLSLSTLLNYSCCCCICQDCIIRRDGSDASQLTVPCTLPSLSSKLELGAPAWNTATQIHSLVVHNLWLLFK